MATAADPLRSSAVQDGAAVGQEQKLLFSGATKTVRSDGLSAPLNGYPTPPPSITADDPIERIDTIARKLHGIEEEDAIEDASETEDSSRPVAFPNLQQDSLRSPSPTSSRYPSGYSTPLRTRARYTEEISHTQAASKGEVDGQRPRGTTLPASARDMPAQSNRVRVQPLEILDFPTNPMAAPLLSAPERKAEKVRPLNMPATARELGRSGDEKVNGVLGGRQTIADRRSRAGSLGLPAPDYRMMDSQSRGPATGAHMARPQMALRTWSTPPMLQRKQSHSHTGPSPSLRNRQPPAPLHLEDMKRPNAHDIAGEARQLRSPDPTPSPMPQIIPLPPVSLHTYLQLELSSQHPSPLYIHRSAYNDFPYESSAIKFQRICNFLLLPPQIERVLLFGAAACFDAWLYNMTILPLRFFKAIWILGQAWGKDLVTHSREIMWYVYMGWRRTWRRYGDPSSRGLDTPFSPPPSAVEDMKQSLQQDGRPPVARTPMAVHAGVSRVGFTSPIPATATTARPRHTSANTSRRHRRTQSQPSNLLPANKADLLKGFLVFLSCIVLQRLDASQMYHDIKGQSAIKLYVIYSVLDVSDRLLSALGQDVLECLFSRETLERKSDGRSKVLRPLGMFILALAYNVIHSSALFYQVITLNVAVNSYSNALLTLLLSSQFVEIKGTVFKKFEKENLFQLTCADVVERFQLGLLLTIIALRNIVEMGFGIITGPNSPFAASLGGASSSASTASSAATYSMLPKSFTIFPSWTGRVTGPFLLVLGSEMLVDWLKHAYIGKFNNTKPAIYGRYLDVLAKDYYTNAFADQNLTKRLGLPVIPLSCLAIRAGIQMWHTFLATNERVQGSKTSYVFPDPASAGGSASSTTTAASLKRFDSLWNQMLHPASAAADLSASSSSFVASTLTVLITYLPTISFVLTIYLLALTMKLVLGMALLHISRNRYHTMKERELLTVEMAGKRVGGWGVVEVDADKRRWIYEGDVKGMREMREREKEKERRLGVGAGVDGEEGAGAGAGAGGGGGGKRKDLGMGVGMGEGGKKGWGVDELKGISRWNMSGKRIW